MLAQGQYGLRDLGILQIDVREVDGIGGEVDLDAIIPPFERRAFKADAGAAEAGTLL